MPLLYNSRLDLEPSSCLKTIYLFSAPVPNSIPVVSPTMAKLLFNGVTELSEKQQKGIIMWIRKRKLLELEKRVAALERINQRQQIEVSLDVPNCCSNDLIIKNKKERKIKCGTC